MNIFSQIFNTYFLFYGGLYLFLRESDLYICYMRFSLSLSLSFLHPPFVYFIVSCGAAIQVRVARNRYENGKKTYIIIGLTNYRRSSLYNNLISRLIYSFERAPLLFAFIPFCVPFLSYLFEMRRLTSDTITLH